MGTPHRGSELANWSLTLSAIVNMASLGKPIRRCLLRELTTTSKALMETSRQFVHRSPDMKLMSFVEQLIEPKLLSLVRSFHQSSILTVLFQLQLTSGQVVSESSAVLGLPNELVFPVNATHRGICRYESAKSQIYMLVEAALREIIEGKAERVDLHHRKHFCDSI